MTQARTLSAVYVSLGPISAGPCEEAFDFLQNGATWLYIRAFVATQKPLTFGASISRATVKVTPFRAKET